MLPGLKSRCTIPAACTAPSATSVATATRSSAAPGPELLDDLYQGWSANIFTDNKRTPFKDASVQNLRRAKPGHPLRRGNLFQKAAPNLRVRGWRQELDRRMASIRAGRQEHDTLPTFTEAAQ
jgi:hypothetical protein